MKENVYVNFRVIRLLHWLNAFSILTLVFTGFYIRWPQYHFCFDSMDQARILHFIFMWVLIAGCIYRIGYAFIFGDWRNFRIKLHNLKEMVYLVRYYLFLEKDYINNEKYNIGQKLTYLTLLFLVVNQLFTGIILYDPGKYSLLAMIIGGDSSVRTLHYLICVIMCCLVTVHIYLALISGIDVIKSMITGYINMDNNQVNKG